jgi:hypothetical protein
MKPYGMTRLNAGDDDAGGCKDNGRATRVYNLPGPGGDVRAYRALRGGRKARVRRIIKRAARRANRVACTEE